MIGRMLLAAAVILIAVGAWIAVQRAAHRYAARHPEFGPAHEEGGEGCAGCAGAGRRSCKRGRH